MPRATTISSRPSGFYPGMLTPKRSITTRKQVGSISDFNPSDPFNIPQHWNLDTDLGSPNNMETFIQSILNAPIPTSTCSAFGTNEEESFSGLVTEMDGLNICNPPARSPSLSPMKGVQFQSSQSLSDLVFDNELDLSNEPFKFNYRLINERNPITRAEADAYYENRFEELLDGIPKRVVNWASESTGVRAAQLMFNRPEYYGPYRIRHTPLTQLKVVIKNIFLHALDVKWRRAAYAPGGQGKKQRWVFERPSVVTYITHMDGTAGFTIDWNYTSVFPPNSRFLEEIAARVEADQPGRFSTSDIKKGVLSYFRTVKYKHLTV